MSKLEMNWFEEENKGVEKSTNYRQIDTHRKHHHFSIRFSFEKRKKSTMKCVPIPPHPNASHVHCAHVFWSHKSYQIHLARKHKHTHAHSTHKEMGDRDCSFYCIAQCFLPKKISDKWKLLVFNLIFVQRMYSFNARCVCKLIYKIKLNWKSVTDSLLFHNI